MVVTRRPFRDEPPPRLTAPLWPAKRNPGHQGKLCSRLGKLTRFCGAAAGHSLTVQGEQGAPLHSFCLGGASGTAEVVHGGATFVQPACLCQVLRGSTSQTPLIKPIAVLFSAEVSNEAAVGILRPPEGCCLAFCRSGGF